MKNVLYISLIVISLLLLPILIIISIKETSLSDFEKTWLYVIVGYVSIACFYIGFYNIRKKDK